MLHSVRNARAAVTPGTVAGSAWSTASVTQWQSPGIAPRCHTAVRTQARWDPSGTAPRYEPSQQPHEMPQNLRPATRRFV